SYEPEKTALINDGESENARLYTGKNSTSFIFVNTVEDNHNHQLSIDAIEFECDKKFSDKMMKNIQFLTQHCKMKAAAQRKYLEGKYSTHTIFNSDLYAAIKNKEDVLFSDDLNATLSNDENESVDDPQAIICQLLGIVDFDDIDKIWDIRVRNSLSLKHYIILLKNNAYFNNIEQRMNNLEQRFIYGHLHDAYKVALQKALLSKLKSQRLIKILQKFADENDEYDEKPSDEECGQYDSSSDKENAEIILQNPKK
ncbi:15059_t:CDS:2, partial [Racocetra fulgida]